MIRLYINDVPHVIEMCEGVPEIRREADPRSSNDRRMTVYPWSDVELARAYVSLRVEAV